MKRSRRMVPTRLALCGHSDARARSYLSVSRLFPGATVSAVGGPRSFIHRQLKKSQAAPVLRCSCLCLSLLRLCIAPQVFPNLAGLFRFLVGTKVAFSHAHDRNIPALDSGPTNYSAPTTVRSYSRIRHFAAKHSQRLLSSTPNGYVCPPSHAAAGSAAGH
jgi:hypothetical protein